MGYTEDLYSMISKIARDAMKYNVPRIAQVASTSDPLKKGRVLVLVPILGWDTNDKGAWCFPKDSNGITTPKRGDWVLVEFIDGDMNLPIYSGIATQMKDMLPGNYDGKETTQLPFESNDGESFLKFDELLKKIIIQAWNSMSIEIDATGLVLKSGDAAGWVPNVIPVCPFSGAVHGGAAAGIVKLKGA